MQNILWLLPAPLSKRWSFSHQIRLVARTLGRRGLNIIFAPARIRSYKIAVLIRDRKISFIMMHGYPDMFPFLFEDIKVEMPPLFLWAQVSGEKLARRYNEIKIKNLYIIPITAVSKVFFERGGFPKITEVIPHMVDINAFHPLSRRERIKRRDPLGFNNKFIFGKVAVNCSRKRLKDLIGIYAEIKDKLRGSALLLKTNRVSAEGEDLGEIAGSLGVGKDIIFIDGYMSAAELNKIYNALDLYCHVSEWEGFGLTVSEAMSAGIPALCHRTQGPGEYLPYREFLVPSGAVENAGESEIGLVDREDFKKKMLFAYENPDILDRFSHMGRQYVVENFSPDVICDKFLRLTSKFN